MCVSPLVHQIPSESGKVLAMLFFFFCYEFGQIKGILEPLALNNVMTFTVGGGNGAN